MEQNADQLFDLKQYEEALELYQKCEQSFSVLIKVSEIYHLTGQFKAAIKTYQQAFALNSSNLKILIKIGKLYTQIGYYKEAVETFNSALSKDDKFALAYGELGYTYYCQESHVEALENFLKCSKYINIVPNFVTQLGNELYSEYKYITAKQYYSFALQLDPKYISASIGLIKVFSKVENYHESLQICAGLLKQDGTNIDVLLYEIENLLYLGEFDMTLKKLNYLNKLNLNSLNDEQEDTFIFLSAKQLFCQHSYLECHTYIEEAMKRNPYDLNLLVLSAKCYKEQQNYQKALDQLERVFDIYGNFYDALQVRYEILTILNRIEEAKEAKQQIDLHYV